MSTRRSGIGRSRCGIAAAPAAAPPCGLGRGPPPAPPPPATVRRPAEHLGTDRRTTLERALEAFEQEHAGARRGHEARGRGAHRPGGPLGCIVRRAREDAHRIEPRPDVVARTLRSPPPHALGTPAADAPEAPDDPPRAGAARARVRGNLIA